MIDKTIKKEKSPDKVTRRVSCSSRVDNTNNNNFYINLIKLT